MKWNYDFLYKSREDFLKDIEKANELVSKLATFQGKLGNEESFKEYYDLNHVLIRDYLKPYLYASMKESQDRRDNQNLSDMQQVQFIFAKLGQATAFESSEILSLGKDYVFKMLEKYPDLEPLRHGFEDLFRKEAHTPSK